MLKDSFTSRYSTVISTGHPSFLSLIKDSVFLSWLHLSHATHDSQLSDTYPPIIDDEYVATSIPTHSTPLHNYCSERMVTNSPQAANNTFVFFAQPHTMSCLLKTNDLVTRSLLILPMSALYHSSMHIIFSTSLVSKIHASHFVRR